MGGTWAVGSKPAGISAVGAMDMAGNIYEWNEDCWHDSMSGAPADGSAWTTGCTVAIDSVLRGAEFVHDATFLRAGRRTHAPAAARHASYGARCARGPFP